MTKIGDILGDSADKLAQDNIKTGDVHMLVLGKSKIELPQKFFV